MHQDELSALIGYRIPDAIMNSKEFLLDLKYWGEARSIVLDSWQAMFGAWRKPEFYDFTSGCIDSFVLNQVIQFCYYSNFFVLKNNADGI